MLLNSDRTRTSQLARIEKFKALFNEYAGASCDTIRVESLFCEGITSMVTLLDSELLFFTQTSDDPMWQGALQLHLREDPQTNLRLLGERILFDQRGSDALMQCMCQWLTSRWQIPYRHTTSVALALLAVWGVGTDISSALYWKHQLDFFRNLVAYSIAASDRHSRTARRLV